MDLLNVQHIGLKDERGFELKDISFSQPAFSRLAIAGETGSGKTTLLKIIGGLIEHDTGTVFFEGKKIIGPQDQLIPGHPGIKFLSQHFELPNNLRVEQVLEYANQLEEQDLERICTICRISHLLKRRTNQLSGGEKQRIAIARLLLTAPKLLLLDEPFSNADMSHKKMIKAVLHDISEALRITCTMVSHDPMDSLSWADHVLVLQHGALVQQGTPKEIYDHPVNEYVAGLFGRYSLLSEATAALFSPRKKRRIVRPEDVKMNDQKGFPAVIRKILYFGSHYELEAEVNGETILVRDEKGDKTAGSTVFLRLRSR